MTLLMERPPKVDEPDNHELLDVLYSLELPPGYKAEIIEGEIVVSPAPSHEHEGYFAGINYQFNIHGWRVSGNYGLRVPNGNYQPDLTVAPKEFFQRWTAGESYRDPEGVALVAEITSSNPDKDRGAKRRGYAAAGIPLYLLVDRQRKEAVLLSGPQGGDYRGVLTVPLGEPIPLPEPFSFTLTDIG